VTRTAPLTAPAGELRTVLGQLTRRLRAEYDVPIGQATVLGRLDRDGAQTTSALAAHEHVRPQSMAEIVADLEAAELVSRRPDPHDRRCILVEITPRGRDQLVAERGRRDDWLAATIRDELTTAEQRTLLAAIPLLRRLVDYG